MLRLIVQKGSVRTDPLEGTAEKEELGFQSAADEHDTHMMFSLEPYSINLAC